MLVGARLALLSRKEQRIFYCSNGGALEAYEKSNDGKLRRRWQLPVFEDLGANIHGIRELSNNELLCFGEWNIAVVNTTRATSRRQKLDDWIISAHVLEDGSIAVLFGRNVVVRYNVSDNRLLEEQSSIKSLLQHRAVILSAAMRGSSWRDLEVFEGTIFGEIHKFQPGRSPEIVQSLHGHKGMIFDLYVLHDRLYSISDDRTMRAWSASTGERLAEVYGHAARPFAVTANAANAEEVVTAGADETLYVWRWTDSTSEKRLILRKRIDLFGGATRSLCFHEGLLIAATDRGTLMAIDIGKSEPISQPSVSHETKIQAFRQLPSRDLFVIDESRTLWLATGTTRTKVLHGHPLRFDSLQTRRDSRYISVSTDRSVFVIHASDLGISQIDLEDVRTSTTWVGDRLLVVQLNGRSILLDPKADGRMNRRDFELRPRTTITCGLLVKGLLVLGTARGLLLLIKETTLEFIRAVKAKDEESVTCIEYLDGALHTLGRNGKHCTWDVDDQEQTLKPINTEATLEWPCELLQYGTRFTVMGFHGSKFVIADAMTRQKLSEVECGGGHRTWQLLDNEDKTFCFHFTHRGLIRSVLLNPHFMQVIQGPFHSDHILSAALIKQGCGEDNFTLITCGNDTRLAVSMVANLREPSATSITPCWTSDRHLSSINDVARLDRHVFTAGGRSELIAWELERPTSQLRWLATKKFNGDYRLLSIDVVADEAGDGRLAIASSNGSVWVSSCELKSNTFTALHEVTPHVHSIISKVRWCGPEIVFCASTSAHVSVYAVADSMELISQVVADNCGLSALAVTRLEEVNDDAVAAAGSESGRITVLLLRNNKLVQVDSYASHSATVTDIVAVPFDHREVDFLSVGLDCRVSLSRFDACKSSIQLIATVLLNVADPSKICPLHASTDNEYNCIVVGSGIQTVAVPNS